MTNVQTFCSNADFTKARKPIETKVNTFLFLYMNSLDVIICYLKLRKTRSVFPIPLEFEILRFACIYCMIYPQKPNVMSKAALICKPKDFTSLMHLRPEFFYFLFYRFFSQQIRVGGGNKIHSDHFPIELKLKETRNHVSFNFNSIGKWSE